MVGWCKGIDTVRSMDMISSLSSGITNVTKDVLRLGLVVLSYGWLVRHVAIIQIKSGILTYFIAFISLDFAGYWSAYQHNFFWNCHIIHHSSEQFNLAFALRQRISVFVQIFGCLLLPAALVGVPEKVIIVVAPLHLFAQF
jgi:alkylglycerol monooxygenase